MSNQLVSFFPDDSNPALGQFVIAKAVDRIPEAVIFRSADEAQGAGHFFAQLLFQQYADKISDVVIDVQGDFTLVAVGLKPGSAWNDKIEAEVFKQKMSVSLDRSMRHAIEIHLQSKAPFVIDRSAAEDYLPANQQQVEDRLAIIMLARGITAHGAQGAHDVGAKVISFDGQKLTLQFIGACSSCTSGKSGTTNILKSGLIETWPDLRVEIQ